MNKVITGSLTLLLVFCVVSSTEGTVGWETVGGIKILTPLAPPPNPPGALAWPTEIANPAGDGTWNYGKYNFPADNWIRYCRLEVDNSIDSTAAYLTQTYSQASAIPATFHSQQFASFAFPQGGATGLWIELETNHGDIQTINWTASEGWTTTWAQINQFGNIFTTDYNSLTIRLGITKDPGTTTGTRSLLIDRCFIWDWVNQATEWSNWDFETPSNPLENRCLITTLVPLPTLTEQTPVPTTYDIYLNDTEDAYPPVADVLVTVDPDDQLSVNGNPAGNSIVLTFTTTEPNLPQTVTILAYDDDIDEGLHTSVITHTSASSDPCYNNLIIQTVTYDIQDNDAIGVCIEPNSLSVAEEGSTTATYTVVLEGAPSGNVVVTADPEDDIEVNSAGEGVAVELTFTTSNWNIAQTVTVAAINDGLSEGYEVKLITHSAAGGGYNSAVIDSVNVTIADNDAPANFFSVTLDGSTGIFNSNSFLIHMYDGEITYFHNKITETNYISGGIDAGSAVKSATLYADGTTAWRHPQDATWPASNVFKYEDSSSSVSKTGPYEITWNFSLNGVTSSVRAWLDPNSQDLCVQQQSSGPRNDLHRLRWAMTNISPALDVIIPFTGGIRLRDSDTDVIRRYFIWPTFWNAQFVVLQGSNEGFWVHTDDTDYITKGLEVDRNRPNNALGFDTEAIPPFTGTSSMTSVNWRINSYHGNWTLPVHQYREWMAENISIPARPEWVKDINLAGFNWPVSRFYDPLYNASSYGVVYDELETLIDPENVLLCTTNWRSQPWGQNFPDYSMSATFDTEHDYLRNTYGLKTVVWINLLQCNTYMSEYTTYSPWQVRNPLDSTDYWPTWFADTAYIHLGLDAWRNELVTRLANSFNGMTTRPNGIFLDESFGYGQSYDGIVDGKNQIEGNEQFHLDFLNNISTPGGLILAGEDLTEISFRGEAFAHIHGYGGNWGPNWRWYIARETHDLLCPVFAVLFTPYTKLYGFWGLDGKDIYSTQAFEAYTILRFEPAIHPLPTDDSGEYHIFSENNHTEMTAVVEEMIARANGSNRTPTLASCSVTPTDGTNVAGFDFQAVYTDLDNEGPGTGSNAYVHVVIDDVVYDLNLVGSSTYTTGASFNLHLDGFSLGSHSVHFECWDTWHVVRYPVDGELTFTVYRDSDVNANGFTNLLDFGRIANQWMQPCSDPGWCVGTDFDHSQTVDFEDVLIFSSEFLK